MVATDQLRINVLAPPGGEKTHAAISGAASTGVSVGRSA
jgi:hypothetical protein